MALIDTLAIFLVNLVIGGIGIYIGASLVVGEGDFGYAVISAFLGALVWAIVSSLISGIPFLGPLLTLIAWIGVINYRYRGGWITATLIGFFSWLVAVGILVLLSSVGITTFSAIGIPL